MKFDLDKSIEILGSTPETLHGFLNPLSEEWTSKNEGGDSWSVYDIMGHLIHGEKTDWIPRLEKILSPHSDKSFEPFDRFAQFKSSEGKSLAQLLDEFKILRYKNLELLRSKNLSDEDLELKGIHPAFGEVTLSQLLAAWTVHDLNHIAQIMRVMAYQYKIEVGPWMEYLGILKNRISL